MVIIFFNILGLGMLAFSAAVAFAVAHLLGASGNAPFMLIAGPLALACDATYRWRSPAGHWLNPTKGGNLCFVPVWVFGALWLALGIAYTITGQDEPGVLGAIIVGIVAFVIVGVAIFRAVLAASSPPSSCGAKEWECSRCGQVNPGRVRVCKQCRLET